MGVSFIIVEIPVAHATPIKLFADDAAIGRSELTSGNSIFHRSADYEVDVVNVRVISSKFLNVLKTFPSTTSLSYRVSGWAVYFFLR